MTTSRQPPKRTRARTPNNRTTTGFRISDALWAVLVPLLPVRVNTHRLGGGRPRVPDRRCADAIFYVLRTGCQWEALNQTELCAKSTAHDRFQEWVEADVFLQRWKAGVEQFDELQGMNWNWLSMDGVMTKAPLGGEKNRAESDRSCQRRGEAKPVD
jgi:putative transposase